MYAIGVRKGDDTKGMCSGFSQATNIRCGFQEIEEHDCILCSSKMGRSQSSGHEEVLSPGNGTKANQSETK